MMPASFYDCASCAPPSVASSLPEEAISASEPEPQWCSECAFDRFAKSKVLLALYGDSLPPEAQRRRCSDRKGHLSLSTLPH